MTDKILSGAFLTLSILCLSCADNGTPSNREDVGLRGKVKSVTEKKYHAVVTDPGNVEKGTFFREEDEIHD